MTAALLTPLHHWYCPNCGKTDVTNEARPHSRFHVCPKLAGLTAPMLPAGTAAKVEAIERQDYIGKDRVQTDENGRPVMSVVTTRDHGQDTAVFAPAATGGVR
jgi:hypothetical protein